MSELYTKTETGAELYDDRLEILDAYHSKPSVKNLVGRAFLGSLLRRYTLVSDNNEDRFKHAVLGLWQLCDLGIAMAFSHLCANLLSHIHRQSCDRECRSEDVEKGTAGHPQKIRVCSSQIVVNLQHLPSKGTGSI